MHSWCKASVFSYFSFQRPSCDVLTFAQPEHFQMFVVSLLRALFLGLPPEPRMAYICASFVVLFLSDVMEERMVYDAETNIITRRRVRS